MKSPSIAPWVRTRLKAAPGAAIAYALLVVLTAFLAAVLPRTIESYETRELRQQIAASTPQQRGFTITATPKPNHDPPEMEAMLAGKEVRALKQHIVADLPAALPLEHPHLSYGVRTTDFLHPTDPELPRPGGIDPDLQLTAQDPLAKHAKLSEGKLPSGDGSGEAIEAAVTTATAKALELRIGQTLHMPAQEEGKTARPVTLAVKITGFIEPRVADSPFWTTDRLLAKPTLAFTDSPDNPRPYWQAALLLSPDAGPALVPTDRPEAFWQLPLDASDLTGSDAGQMLPAVRSMKNGPGMSQLRETVYEYTPIVSTELDATLGNYIKLRDAITPIVAVAAFSVGTVAAVVLLMAGGLAADRRRHELTLLRSRGGSLWGIGRRLTAELAAVTLPAAALGCALALLAVPEATLRPPLIAAASVAALATLWLPLRTVAALRRPRPAAREDLATAKPSRRRTVAELTGLVLCVGAVIALRRRGTEPGETDALISAAPVLIGVIAAALLVRVYPLPLRLAARPAARGRGLTGFLSLARAGRARGTAVLPLLALLIALTTAAVGGSVTTGVAEARDRAAALATGGDARIAITDGWLPEDFAKTVAEVEGLREVQAVRAEADITTGEDSPEVTLLQVDPAAYARLTEHLNLPGFEPSALSAKDTGKPLPAIASPRIAKAFGKQPLELDVPWGTVTAKIASTREATPAMTGSTDEFIIVDERAVAAGIPAGYDSPAANPNIVLALAEQADGSGIDAAALRTAAREASRSTEVRLREEARAALSDTELQAGAERLYTGAVAAAAGFAALAVLLSLLQAAPERAALLARLRTMGCPPRQRRRLLALEAVPQMLLAAIGGILTGLAAIKLLAPGLDLTALASTVNTSRVSSASQVLGTARLSPEPYALALPAVGVLLLIAAVTWAQAWWTGRRNLGMELRAGDRS